MLTIKNDSLRYYTISNAIFNQLSYLINSSGQMLSECLTVSMWGGGGGSACLRVITLVMKKRRRTDLKYGTFSHTNGKKQRCEKKKNN